MMAQVTIAHFVKRSNKAKQQWCHHVEQIACQVVHGKTPEPSDITIRSLNISLAGSLSDADTELHVEISGNDWPRDERGVPLNHARAKVHFDKLAQIMSDQLASIFSNSAINIWVTPYQASGWAAIKRSAH